MGGKEIEKKIGIERYRENGGKKMERKRERERGYMGIGRGAKKSSFLQGNVSGELISICRDG